MQFCLVAAGKKSGRFEDDVDFEILPWQGPGVAFLQDPNLVIADDDVLVVVTYLAVELAMNRVPFKQMREGARVGEIINRANALHLFLCHGAQDIASNSPETINSVISHKLKFPNCDFRFSIA